MKLPDYLWGIETSSQSLSSRSRHSFQTTYEELKLDVLNGLAGLFGASRLPMRNWNCLREWTTTDYYRSFQTTYEELKRIWTIVWTIISTASRLPMRNWNDFPVLYSCKATATLPDYLWGIETCRVLWSWWQRFCFQTTYEELKLCHRQTSYIMSVFSFQTTYEELKPWALLLVLKVAGFQTTYEELKPFPMQNDDGSQYQLPDYLWGIETFLEPFSRITEHELPDYLWGIETCFPLHWDDLSYSCFQTTYEELKLCRGYGVLPLSLRASRLPMRNWNATASLSSMRNQRRLPDYLWGIETWCSQWPCWPVRASRLPMRNWNLSALRFESSDVRFQTTYEELKPGYADVPELPEPGFQTTYEELKHDNGYIYFKKNVPASRLPMRNWNLDKFVIHRQCSLPDYLWGIETPSESPQHSEEAASRLPMRNWNWVSSRVCSSKCASRLPMRNWNDDARLRDDRHRRFQTTYEELKHACEEIEVGEESASRLPMRNWNDFPVLYSCKATALPDYLWGIETLDTEIPELSSAMASRLPMRNWNPGMPTFRNCPSRASRLPMRNWNERFPVGSTRPVRLPDYLWGIETWNSPGRFWRGFASRLPMRNWNLASAVDITFELFRLPDYLWGIETNLDGIARLICYRFQTTYEELKLHIGADVSVSIAASRLPMRNWNVIRAMSPTSRYIPLPDYLWGIETRVCRRSGTARAGLPDYLWGIETPVALFEAHRLVASRLPMRNWNVVLCKVLCVVIRLPDYLWGIETTFVLVFVFFGTLPDYLWGIETHVYDTDVSYTVGFQTTYEELKLSQMKTCAQSAHISLPDYLWGIETPG